MDATGDTTFSKALNAFKGNDASFEEYPDLLFAWLEGFGAATQALLVNNQEKACYQCLSPIFGEVSRYTPLKDPGRDHFISATCTDGVYIPYSVAASATAAGLALEMMLDWASGKNGNRLRTRAIDTDPTVTKLVKDRSPDRDKRCPKCFPTL